MEKRETRNRLREASDLRTLPSICGKRATFAHKCAQHCTQRKRGERKSLYIKGLNLARHVRMERQAVNEDVAAARIPRG
jgi:hypothetical protein